MQNRAFPGFNHVQVINKDALLKVLHDRPKGVALLTVVNHHSCMDEPLLWGEKNFYLFVVCLSPPKSVTSFSGILGLKELFDNSLMRWCLAAHDICFTKGTHATFFAYGKSIPVVRGAGVHQVREYYCLLLLL